MRLLVLFLTVLSPLALAADLRVTDLRCESQTDPLGQIVTSDWDALNRLIRVTYGPFSLEDLGPGALEEIDPAELLAQVGNLIPEKRRPKAFARRETSALRPQHAKPLHAKQKPKSQPEPRTAADDGKRRKGLNAFVDNRPQKNRPPRPARPGGSGPKRPGGGGKPVRGSRGPR